MTQTDNDALADLRDMLEDVDREEDCTVFNHTPEEIGIEVMKNHEAILAALRSTPQAKSLDPPTQDEVEVVARVINPHAWAIYDRSLVPFAEKRGARSSTDDCATYQLMWKDGCRTVEDAKSWWLTNERPVMVRVHHFRESLRQAIAAIAALDRHPAGDDALREENARLRGALRDASVSLWWAARQMKGNCNGGAVDAVNLAAEDASSVAALTGRQG